MASGVSSSLYDLAGNLIQNTYTRVLQKATDNYLYDGSGSLVDNFKISGSLTAVSFSGNGSNLTNVPEKVITTTLITSSNSPYILTNSIRKLYIDTASGSMTASLATGSQMSYSVKIINTGTENNDVLILPVINERLFGEAPGTGSLLMDGEVFDLDYNSTEGWW